ncbi:ParA family protein [Rhodopirellula europaea]|uniref:ParA family protein n=1 Tax=Rhodopirellula europaea TaxID=1263866 RepID=UPI003D2759BC
MSSLPHPKTAANSFPVPSSLDTRIRRNIRLAEAPSFGQSIFDYSGESNGAIDYQSLAEEVLAQEVANARKTSSVSTQNARMAA